jgi:acyl-CoA hydrolase
MVTRAGRRSTPSEAVASIPDGARVFVAPSGGTPLGLVAEVDRQRDRWRSLELVAGYLFTRLAVHDHPGEPFTFASTQPSAATRALAAAGQLRIVPARYSDYGGLFRPGSPLAVDVMLVQVSPPGPDGRVSLGVSVGANVDVMATTPLVIAQVNPRMPYTFGDGELPVDAFDHLVDIDEPLVELPAGKADAVTAAVAERAAALIADGSTVQFGIGALPDAVLAGLGGRRDLRVHSGMVSDACIDLVERGAVVGELVAAEAIGGRRLYDWVHRNPRVRLMRSGISHGALALGAAPNFVAINSAVEVALDGSVNAEVAGGRVISGPGGSPDFSFAASAAVGGRLILALPSTAGNGVSRIVRAIEPPAPVTLPNYLADHVVTEWGVASLRGVPLAERAQLLTEIAHPDHRAALAGAG